MRGSEGDFDGGVGEIGDLGAADDLERNGVRVAATPSIVESEGDRVGVGEAGGLERPKRLVMFEILLYVGEGSLSDGVVRGGVVQDILMSLVAL